jgi:hypothetical protein
MRRTLLHLLGLSLGLTASALASQSPLVVQRVVGKASAGPRDLLAPWSTFTTARGSKSELVTDHGIVRVGSNVELHTDPGGPSFRRGTALFSSNPARVRQTMAFRVPGYHFKVKGTAQISVDPGRSIWIAVFEGSMSVSLDSMTGESQELSAGQMLIVRPSDRRLPDAVEVDLQRLTATSALVRGAFGPLPINDRIDSAIAAQSLALRRGDLEDTRIVLRGLSNAIEVQRVLPGERPRQVKPVVESQSNLLTGVNDVNNPSAVLREHQYIFPSLLSRSDALNDTELVRDERNPARTNILSVELTQRRTPAPGGRSIVDRGPQISGVITVDPDLFTGKTKTLKFLVQDRVAGFERLNILPGTIVTTPAGVDLDFEASYGLDAKGATLVAGKAGPEVLTLSVLEGGISIAGGSVLRGGTLKLKSGATNGRIAIDSSKLTAQRDLQLGDIVPTSIRIGNSSELQSLIGNLDLKAFRAAIDLGSGAKLSAKKAIVIDAFLKDARAADGSPVTTPGVVTLQNTQLTSASIRVRGFADASDALVVDGSTLNATQLIKLYAEGASTLRFRNAVTLNTPLAVLAGKTVEVDSGGSVNVSGKGRVFTDRDNYNKSGYGTIQAKGGLVKGSYNGRESFNR